jgi:hypothetical protein
VPHLRDGLIVAKVGSPLQPPKSVEFPPGSRPHFWCSSLAAEFYQARSDPSETPSDPVLFTVIVVGSLPAQAIPFTLNFGGLQNNEQILSFYDGGTGSLGSGPDTNFGVVFNSTFVAVSDVPRTFGTFFSPRRHRRHGCRHRLGTTRDPIR